MFLICYSLNKTSKKRLVDKTISKLKFANDYNCKTYKIDTIFDNAIYAKKSNNHYF